MIHEKDTFFGCQVDHVISRKHGGATEAANLSYACAACNRNKGSDIASVDRATGELIRFFHPRLDRWSDHFQLRDDTIQPLTAIGEVTARILRFNAPERLLERQELRIAGRYPPARVVPPLPRDG